MKAYKNMKKETMRRELCYDAAREIKDAKEQHLWNNGIQVGLKCYRLPRDYSLLQIESRTM